MQSLIETRAGGESGILAVRAHAGDDLWAAMERSEWSQALFNAALKAARNVAEGDPRENCRRHTEYGGLPGAIAWCLEYSDGLRATHIMLAGHLEDFTFALQLR